MRKILQKAILFAVLFYVALGQSFVFAQVQWCNPPGGPAGRGISTAIGCISVVDSNEFIVSILKFALGIGGGIAFLLMIVGTFQITTSSGSPEKLKAGQELITSALIGLLMILFSAFLLKLIGVDILGIPGFSI